MDELLHASGGVAAYRWGSLLIETSPLTAGDGRSVVETLAALAVNAFPSATEKQQRTAIALIHELVHLQQDVATGLGAWDHLVTRTAYTRLAVQSRWLVVGLDEPPYKDVVSRALASLGSSAFADEVRSDLGTLHEDTVALRQLRGATWATPSAIEFVESLLGRRVPSHDIEDLSLRRMFEGEAACIVYALVMSSKHSANGIDWLDEHSALWQLGAMDSEYSACILQLATAIENGVPSDESLSKAIRAYAILLPWVVDLACAYPSPNALADWQGDRRAFDPVIRYGAILRALNALSAERTQELMEHVMQHRWSEAEDVFRAASNLEYPSSGETYGRWLEELTAISEGDDWDAPLFRLRFSAFESRLNGRPAKGLAAMLDSETPIQILVQGTGIRGIVHGSQFGTVRDLGRALLDRRFDMEMYTLIHGDGRFLCPYGRAAVCDARIQRCTDGILRLGEFPETPGCYVRQSLEAQGWAM